MQIDNAFVQYLKQIPFRASPEQKEALKTALLASTVGRALQALATDTQDGSTVMRSLIDNTLCAQGHEDLCTMEALDAFRALRETLILARAWLLCLGLPHPTQAALFAVTGY